MFWARSQVFSPQLHLYSRPCVRNTPHFMVSLSHILFLASTASKGGDISGLVGQLTGAFGTSTNALSSLTGQQTQGDPTAAVTGIVSVSLHPLGSSVNGD